MKINFTKKEYHLLIDMLYLSDWVMHSHSTSDEDSDYKTAKKANFVFLQRNGYNGSY